MHIYSPNSIYNCPPYILVPQNCINHNTHENPLFCGLQFCDASPPHLFHPRYLLSSHNIKGLNIVQISCKITNGL